MSGEQLRRQVRQWRERTALPPPPSPPSEEGDPLEILDLKQAPTERDLMNLLEQVCGMQGALNHLDTRQETVNIAIKTQEPIILCFSGDWHIGGDGTDHTALQNHLRLIRETPHCYVLLMGDYCDNFQPRGTPPATGDQVIPAGPQLRLAAHFFAYVAEKVLGFIEGNHDNWTWKLVGFSYVQAAAERLTKPYLRHGGTVNLKVGNTEYRIAIRHDFRFKSALNSTNSQRQMFHFTGGADIVALGHLHFGEIHHKEIAGRETIWLRNGTFKVDDDFAYQIGVGKGQPVMPAVVLYPTLKKMIPFRRLEDAVACLQPKRG